MTGLDFEEKCARILRGRGFSHVSVTKKSGDQGIDIIAHKNGKKYGIQCKYYSQPVGNGAIQEAFSGAKYYNCDIAAVMTNATFTPAAKELAKKTHVLLWSNTDINSFGYSSVWSKSYAIIHIIAIIFGALILLIARNSEYFSLYDYACGIALILASTCAFISTKPTLILSTGLYTLNIILDIIYTVVHKHSVSTHYILIMFIPLLSVILRILVHSSHKSKNEEQ